ncbi:histone acetyltransferase 1 [Savitreella phatthalungensis]
MHLRFRDASSKVADYSHGSRSFQPDFTYPFFGEAEQIFGYKGLKIQLVFARDSLLQWLTVSWDGAIALDADGKEIKAPLLEYLAPDLVVGTENEALWTTQAANEADDFAPLGDCVATYITGDTRDGDEGRHEIWRCSCADETFKKRVSRMQIFSMFFIEGASLIDITDDRFDVWVTYRLHGDGKYEFVGYCTCYRYNFYDTDTRRLDVQRYRISQFLVLPTAQRQGHGGKLYDAIIDYCSGCENIKEVTVEDPSPRFMRLRNKQDIRRLKSTGIDLITVRRTSDDDPVSSGPEGTGRRAFARLAKGDLALELHLERLQRELKISPVQLRRLVKRARRKAMRDASS